MGKAEVVWLFREKVDIVNAECYFRAAVICSLTKLLAVHRKT